MYIIVLSLLFLLLPYFVILFMNSLFSVEICLFLICQFSSFCNSSLTKKKVSFRKIMRRRDILLHQNYTSSSHSSLIMATKLKGRENVCRYCTSYKNIYLPKFTSLSKIRCIFSILWPISSYLNIPEKGTILNVMASKKRYQNITFFVYCIVKEKKQRTEACACL